MRQTCLNMVYELAKNDDRIFFIGSDLGKGTLDAFRNNIPERFLMEGISEANVVGIAAGLAMEGKIVYVNTIASFISRRCFEQIVIDLCLHNLNVRLIGNGGGLVYAPLGPTHMTVEDIAIFRALPNMCILAPSDAEEMKRIMPKTPDHQGPIYIRLAKGYDPVVSRDDPNLTIGKAVLMQEGSDILLITTGITLKIALGAAQMLEKSSIACTILHMPTIKPIDASMILKYAQNAHAIITIEEHSILGGLGGAVAELIAETDFDKPIRFRRIGIPDMFPDEYGSQDSLMARFSISADRVVNTVKQLRG